MRAEQKKTDQVFVDRDWWLQFVPTGYRLYGFTDRKQASVIRDGDNRLVDVNGDFMQALVDCGKLRP